MRLVHFQKQPNNGGYNNEQCKNITVGPWSETKIFIFLGP